MTPLKVSTHRRSQLRLTTTFTAAFALALAAGAYPACSPSNEGGSGVNPYGPGSGGRNGGGSSGSAGAVGGAGGNSGSGIGGIGGGGINVDSGPRDSGTNCGEDIREATKVTKIETVTEVVTERAPADVFIMFDQSQSMDAMEGGSSRWQAVTQATIGFVQSPDSAGLGVGIQFFGRAFALEDCNPATYSQPEVPIAVLPGNAARIVGAINAHRPTSETPTASALNGAITYARNWKTQNPTHPVFVLLVTDGEPGTPLSGFLSPTCTQYLQDMPSTVAAADTGFKGSPPIPTYVLGVGPSLANLDQIAVAGGTDRAYLISGANVAQQVIDALNKIRGTISTTITKEITKEVPVPLDCEWVMPGQSGSQAQDPTKVNVRFTTGGVQTPLGIVPNAAECATHQNAWYYDNPAAPTKLIACPSTCDTIKAAGGDAKISIIVGCDTIIAYAGAVRAAKPA